jgi:hypothetical protein
MQRRALTNEVASQIFEIQKRPSPHGSKMSLINPEKIF